ncbi:hypothetical protein CORC01_08499 [Colletotrichum orchidophilum]|uniref:Uncharacterized protein n=1 Tax=Colletotrichum orchidophilum TaxID=1209926 RepID=A0A1G4B4C1_9PEZI|nr:uncharacterized protein CORC01_08499 [Colletotrichum orchidophilum]OHE96122.1 hypothetical protein CORC01_08499 [Colletotrichum orchidophilum]
MLYALLGVPKLRRTWNWEDPANPQPCPLRQSGPSMLQCCNAAMHPPTYRHIAHLDKSDECRSQPVGGSHVPLPPRMTTL